MSDTPKIHHFNRALVRKPAGSVIHGLRADDRGDPDFSGIEAEHCAYINALQAAGVEVTVLPALEAFPDSIFVEDPALVFANGAILLRPGNETRRGETEEIAPVLHDHFKRVLTLPGGGYVDGGDILNTATGVMIGLSARTDRAGAEALDQCLRQLGLTSQTVTTPPDVLHFKTDCSLLDETRVLTTARLAASGVFEDLETVIVPDGEEAAANALRVNDVVMVGAQFPRTQEKLDKRGFTVVPIPTDQIGLIDAGLSCMSLRWFDETS
jgi:dimethylargininase